MAAAKLRSLKLQSGILLGSCFFLSFFALSILLLHFAMTPSFDASYRKLDAPNFCAGIDETDLTAASLETFIRGLPYVEQYELSKRYLANHVELLDQNMNFAYLAASNCQAPASGQVIVNSAVSGVQPGDIVRLHINDRTVELSVASVVTDPVNSAPENRIPYFYVNEQELEQLSEGSEKGSFYVKMRLTMETGQEQQFSADFEAYFGRTFSGELYTMSDIRRSFLFRYDLLKEFAIFFFLILFLILMILMLLLTQMELQDDVHVITILRSVGFTDGNICLIYVCRIFFLTIPGAVLGITASAVVMEQALSGIFASIGTKIFAFLHLPVYSILVMTALCIIMTVLTWILSVRLLRRLSEHGAPPPSSRSGGRLRFRHPRFFYLAFGFQKSMAQKTQSILILFLSLGLGALSATSFYLINGVLEADAHLEDWGIADLDIYVARKTNTDEKSCGLLDKLKEDATVDYYYAALSDYVICQIGKNGQKHRILAEIYDKEIPPELSFSFAAGRNPQNNRETAVGMNFAKEHQIAIGDKLILLHGEQEQILSVVGIYPSYKAYADSIRIITPDIQTFFQNQAEGYYSIVLQEGEDIGLYIEELSNQFDEFNFFPMQRSNTGFIKTLFYPLAAVMCLLLYLYCFLLVLLKKWMYTAYRNELKLWYHLGMTRRKIGKIVRWRFMIPILAGSVIAIPVSIYGFPLWMRPLANRLGLLELPVYPNAGNVILTLLGIILVGMFAGRNTWKNTDWRKRRRND